jgi:hypothetical protein
MTIMLKITALVSVLCSSFCMGGNVPISYHDIVVVEPSGDAVIRLKGYDLDGDKVSLLKCVCVCESE